MRRPKSDPQQFLCYKMENEAIGARNYMHLSKAATLRFIKQITRTYRLPKVKVRWKNLGQWAAQWVEPDVIEIGTRSDSRDVLTIAHEMAHHLHFHIAPDLLHESHGPQFMGCYLSILDTCRIVPVVGMRAICAHYKIKFVDPGTNSSWRTLRRAVRG